MHIRERFFHSSECAHLQLGMMYVRITRIAKYQKSAFKPGLRGHLTFRYVSTLLCVISNSISTWNLEIRMILSSHLYALTHLYLAVARERGVRVMAVSIQCPTCVQITVNYRSALHSSRRTHEAIHRLTFCL